MTNMSAKNALRTLTSIVAIDLRGAIGCDNTLPWRLKSDMAFFRQNTIGNTVIMGRKTYNSLGSKPLPRRNNIVLSHNNVLFENAPACQLALSVEEALFLAERNADDEIFVIGGAQTYEQFDCVVDRYLVTIVDHEVPNADAHLSETVLSSFRDWNRVELAKYVADDEDEFAFAIYELTAPDCAKRREARKHMIEGHSQKIAPKRVRSGATRTKLAATQDAFVF